MGNIPDHVNGLERELRQTDFEILDPGEYHITEEIYPAIKDAYPSRCDESVMCQQTCGAGANQEEWKHRVRTALGKLRDQESSRVEKGKRYYWRFD